MTASEIFQQLFLKENLTDIYNQRILESETVGIDRVHPQALGKVLDDELATIQRKVRSGTYRFTAYKEVLLPKGAGSPPRLVSVPSARDRIVLRTLYELLANVFPDAVSEIAQAKITSIIESLQRGDFGEFIKVDVSQFYPTINQDILLKKLKTRIRKPEILSLIESAIQTPSVPASKGGKGAQKNLLGVPQGLAISNILAEIFLQDFDTKICRNKNIFYQRYVDDILVLCKTSESENVFRNIFVELKDIGLAPHQLNAPNSKSKSGSILSDFEFLGYRFVNGLISVRSQSILKLESSFANILTSYRHKFAAADTPIKRQRARAICRYYLNLRITGCIYEEKRIGWVFYFSQITDTSKLRALDHTVECLLKRFNPTGEIKTKRLLKTYYESRRTDKATHKYITNFDLISVGRQRQILALLTGQYEKIKKCTDEEIVKLYKMKIRKVVQALKGDFIDGSYSS